MKRRRKIVYRTIFVVVVVVGRVEDLGRFVKGVILVHVQGCLMRECFFIGNVQLKGPFCYKTFFSEH